MQDKRQAHGLAKELMKELELDDKNNKRNPPSRNDFKNTVNFPEAYNEYHDVDPPVQEFKLSNTQKG